MDRLSDIDLRRLSMNPGEINLTKRQVAVLIDELRESRDKIAIISSSFEKALEEIKKVSLAKVIPFQRGPFTA